VGKFKLSCDKSKIDPIDKYDRYMLMKVTRNDEDKGARESQQYKTHLIFMSWIKNTWKIAIRNYNLGSRELSKHTIFAK